LKTCRAGKKRENYAKLKAERIEAEKKGKIGGQRAEVGGNYA
jgi:hypothetical protein